MPTRVNRREFLTHVAVGTAVLTAGSTVGRASAQTVSPHPDWIPASTKPESSRDEIGRAHV